MRTPIDRALSLVVAPLRLLGITRDSASLKLAVLGSIFAFLATLPPPPTWGWTEWMQLGAFAVGLIAAQLGSSRLPGRDQGERIDPGRFSRADS